MVTFYRRAPVWTCVIALVLLGATACQHRAVGSRVPPPTDVYDMRPIDIANFASDANLRRRILFMPYGEAAQRLGAMHFEANSNFVFSQGGQDLEQNDRFRISQDATGAVHVVSQTPTSQVEVYLIGENVYVRYEKGQARQKSRRDTDTDELTAVAWSSLAEVLALFPRATFTDPRHDSVGGRSVSRYHIALAKEAAPGSGASAVIAPPLPITPHARWRDLAKPLDLSGTLSVDTATGVILKAEVDGRIEINDRPVRPTELIVHYRSVISEVGHVPMVKAPRSVAEFRRPQKARDPLAFFRDHLAPLQNGAADKDKDKDKEEPEDSKED